MNVAMKKKSLEDSLSGHTAQVEEERKIELLEGKKFETLYDYYEEALRVGQRSDYIPFPRLALTPKEINAFLRSTIKYEHLDEYNNYRGSMATGRFINSLIGQSYDAGHNDFILNCKSLPLISFLGSSLKADQERQLNLTVEGDVYTAFGNWIENCFFHQ